MLAKVIATGADRTAALERLAGALDGVRIAGPRTNLAFLAAIVAHPDFLSGGVDTGFVESAIGDLGGSPPDPAMAAGAIVEWVRREASRHAAGVAGPWARLDGFELGGLERRNLVELQVEGQPAAAEIRWAGEGPEVLSIGGRPSMAFDAGETVWGGRDAYLLRGGQQMRIAFADPLARNLDARQAGGEVSAPMHGRVVALAIAPGERVVKGELLFTLEAMKMEHSVLAPLSGIVRSVRIAAGQQVEQGAPAVSIEPGEPAKPVD